MKEYNYTDIVRFDKNGIVLADGETIQFEKCKIEWAKEKKIDSKETSCIAVRFSDRNSGHFIFYTNERIKLNFKFGGIFKSYSRKKFNDMQSILIKYGYTSYDES